MPSSSTFTLEDSAIYLTSEQSTLETENDNASVLDVYLVSCQSASGRLFFPVISLIVAQQGTWINTELKEPEVLWGISKLNIVKHMLKYLCKTNPSVIFYYYCVNNKLH